MVYIKFDFYPQLSHVLLYFKLVVWCKISMIIELAILEVSLCSRYYSEIWDFVWTVNFYTHDEVGLMWSCSIYIPPGVSDSVLCLCRYGSLKDELEGKRHEAEMVKTRMEQSTHHQQLTKLQKLKDTISECIHTLELYSSACKHCRASSETKDHGPSLNEAKYRWIARSQAKRIKHTIIDDPQ